MTYRAMSFVCCVAAVAALVLAGCPNFGLSDEEILRLNDSVQPAVTITSHGDGDPYAPVTTLAGFITDLADSSGSQGQVESATFSAGNGYASGDINVATTGEFSVEIDAQGFSGTLRVEVAATDWYGNTGSAAVSLAPPREITYFAFLQSDNPSLSEDAIGIIDGTDILVALPPGSDWSALVATFETTAELVKIGTDEQESGHSEYDFSSAVQYTAVGNDLTTKTYTVRVGNRHSLSYARNAVDAVGEMEAHVLLDGETVNLSPCAFTRDGYGFTGWALAADGAVAYDDTASFTMGSDDVTLYAQWASSAKEITAYRLDAADNPDLDQSVTGDIQDRDIWVEVPTGTSVTALVATFETTGVSVTVSGEPQISGSTPNDFTEPPLDYVVTADDDSTQLYNIFVVPVSEPSVTTESIVGDFNFLRWLDGTSARLVGNITETGGSRLIEAGFCWNTTGDPSLSDSSEVARYGATGGSFSDTVYGLSEETDYYVRAYVSNVAGMSYGNEIVFNSGLIVDGSLHHGGYVFYNDGTGGGLVCAPNDQAAMYVWSNIDDQSVSGTSLDFGTGLANSGAIVSQAGHTTSAAQLCLDHDDGTYSDWYLPSFKELELVQQRLYDQGIGTFGQYYWSSSEYSSTMAYICGFGVESGYDTKEPALFSVRAIRSF